MACNFSDIFLHDQIQTWLISELNFAIIDMSLFANSTPESCSSFIAFQQTRVMCPTHVQHVMPLKEWAPSFCCLRLLADFFAEIFKKRQTVELNKPPPRATPGAAPGTAPTTAKLLVTCLSQLHSINTWTTNCWVSKCWLRFWSPWLYVCSYLVYYL